MASYVEQLSLIRICFKTTAKWNVYSHYECVINEKRLSLIKSEHY